MKNEELLDLETAYIKLQPLLFGALAKLVRQGFNVSPQDSLDLIHDFFVESWDSIKSNYDANKGSFISYIYTAFINFARPRVIKLQRLQISLIEQEILNQVSLEPSVESDYLVKSIRDAISKLPMLEKNILTTYLYSENITERMLSKQFAISRYHLKEILITALGKIAVSFDKPKQASEADWKVALALWHDGRTIDEAAAFLGITAYQVRLANARNVKLLQSALKNYRTT